MAKRAAAAAVVACHRPRSGRCQSYRSRPVDELAQRAATAARTDAARTRLPVVKRQLLDREAAAVRQPRGWRATAADWLPCRCPHQTWKSRKRPTKRATGSMQTMWALMQMHRWRRATKPVHSAAVRGRAAATHRSVRCHARTTTVRGLRAHSHRLPQCPRSTCEPLRMHTRRLIRPECTARRELWEMTSRCELI